jgi:hypothetical protein
LFNRRGSPIALCRECAKRFDVICAKSKVRLFNTSGKSFRAGLSWRQVVGFSAGIQSFLFDRQRILDQYAGDSDSWEQPIKIKHLL